MHLIEIDVVGLEPSEAPFTRLPDPLTPAAPHRGIALIHGHAELGGDDHLLASAAQRLPEELFRPTGT